MTDIADDSAIPADAPSLGRKLISSANWGMLAGFWVELPLLIGASIKSKGSIDFHKLNNLSLKLVLPATVVGVVYGWMHPAHSQQVLPSGPRKPRHAPEAPSASWATAEQGREEDFAPQR